MSEFQIIGRSPDNKIIYIDHQQTKQAPKGWPWTHVHTGIRIAEPLSLLGGVPWEK